MSDVSSPELEMLYRDVLARPRDDTPRLVYAEAIEDDQPDRAEFIRLQCGLARVAGSQDPECQRAPKNNPGGDAHGYVSAETGQCVPCIDCWSELRRRERELWEGPCTFDGWARDATRPGRLVRSGTGIVAFAMRGFIFSLTCAFADWLAHHERLFWSPGQTAECPECRGTTRLPGWHEDEGDFSCGCDRGRIPRSFTVEVQCPECKGRGTLRQENSARNMYAPPCTACGGYDGPIFDPRPGTGRITQPLTAAQPIERVRFTAFPASPSIDTNGLSEVSVGVIQFIRHPDDTDKNEWYCDRWPGVIFEMPESELNRFLQLLSSGPFINAPGGDFSLNLTGAGALLRGAGEQVQLMAQNL